MTLRQRLAQQLRFLADRIDYAGAPKALHWSFTIEDQGGVRFREDGRGCRLWYLGDAEYDKAHTEADTEHVRVDWATMRVSRVGGPAAVNTREELIARTKPERDATAALDAAPEHILRATRIQRSRPL